MVAVQSDKRSLLEISEIADLTIKEQLQTISDVSAVQIWGEKRYSMRIWLDPDKMAGHGITPIDVKSALDKENVELPSGSIEGNTTELTIRTMGLMHTAKEFNDLVIKKNDTREAFDRTKILNGVMRACQKRPVSLEQMENIVNDIENELQNSLTKEVTTSKIGEMVMDKLKARDQVAYVRFASVYREFTDVEHFLSELMELKNVKKDGEDGE
jgi:transcriptional regulator NrdR